jgi:hypothetical protein
LGLREAVQVKPLIPGLWEVFSDGSIPFVPLWIGVDSSLPPYRQDSEGNKWVLSCQVEVGVVRLGLFWEHEECMGVTSKDWVLKKWVKTVCERFQFQIWHTRQGLCDRAQTSCGNKHKKPY